MSTETKLRTAMAEAVAPEVPDTDHLVSSARRQGLGIRRRRQALAGVGIAAALAVATAAPLTIAGSTSSREDGLSVGTQTRSFDPSQTSPISGRSTAAALVYAVGQEANGTATGFRGQVTSADGIVMAYGAFSYSPDGSSNPGQVGVNVQLVPPETQAKDPRKGGDGELADDRCDTFMEHCEITHLADGSVLRTYQLTSEYGDRHGLVRVAELNRPDHLRVLATASNGYDITERDEQVNRVQPVLTTAQLVDVVTQPWWSAELPTYFADQGDQLKPYNAIEGGPIAATPAAKP